MQFDSIVNTAAGKNNMRIQKGVQRLLIHKSDGYAFNAEMINVKLKTKNGDRTIIQNTYVKELIPFTGFGHSSSAVVSGTYYCAIIELAAGNIDLDNGDEIIVDMSGTTAASCTYTLYGIGSPRKANEILKYDRSSVQASTTSREFGVGNSLLAAVYNNTTRITLLTDEGKQLILEPNELKALDASNLDFGYVGLNDSDTGTAPLYVTDNYYLISMEGIQTLIVDTDGSADCPVIMLNTQAL